jgi:hypothetical protein
MLEPINHVVLVVHDRGPREVALSCPVHAKDELLGWNDDAGLAGTGQQAVARDEVPFLTVSSSREVGLI